MDIDSEDDQLMLVPAALQSGHTTPSRLSQISQENAVVMHPYAAAKPSNSGWDAEPPSDGLQAFPRPRSSIDDTGGVEAEDKAVDPRIERRKRNQYKRHGSLTLAWQQQQQQAEESRHVAACLSETHLSDMCFAGSPMAAPITSYPRNVYQTNVPSYRHSAAGQYEPPKTTQHSRFSGAHSAIAAVAGSRIVTRLRSSSLVSSRSSKASRAESRYSGSRLGNDGLNQSSSASGLFAPVNSYRTSSSSSVFRASLDYSRSRVSSRDTVSSATGAHAGSRLSKNRGSAQRLAPTGMPPVAALNASDMCDSPADLLSERSSSYDSRDSEAASESDKQHPLDELLLSPLGDSVSKAVADDNGNIIKPFADKGDSSSRTKWLEGTSSIVAPATHSSRSSKHYGQSICSSNCPDSTKATLADSPHESGRGADLSPCGDGGSCRPNISVRVAEASMSDESHAHPGNVGGQRNNCAFADVNVCGVGVRGKSSTCAQQTGGSSSVADRSCQRKEDVHGTADGSSVGLAENPQELRQLGDSASGCLLPHQNLAPQHYSQEQPHSACSSSFFPHFASAVSDTAASIAPAFTFVSPPGFSQSSFAFSIEPFAATDHSNGLSLSNISEVSFDCVETAPEQSKDDKRCRRARLVSNPPTFPLPQLPAADMSTDTNATTSMRSNCPELPSHPIGNCSEQIPNSAPESTTQTAINTAACTPVASSTRASAAAADTSGDFTKVGDDRKQTAAFAYQNTIHSSPTHFVLRSHKSMGELKQRSSESATKPPLAEPAAHLQGTGSRESGDMYANSSVCDRQLHNNDVSLSAADDGCAHNESDLTRHPTLVFDQSPFFRASALISVPVSSSRTASTLDEHEDVGAMYAGDECAEPNELESGASCVPIPASAASDLMHTSSIDGKLQGTTPA